MYSENRNLFFRLSGGEPIELRWGPWVTNTNVLQREGWKFHAQEEYRVDYDAHQVRLGATSPDTSICVMGNMMLKMQELMERHPYGLFHQRPFMMNHYTVKDIVRTLPFQEVRSISAMQPIDINGVTTVSSQSLYMKDFKIFAPASDDTQKEIYIPEKNVDELFNQILKIQYPEQKEIKKGIIMPEKKPLIQAKIFTLVA